MQYAEFKNLKPETLLEVEDLIYSFASDLHIPLQFSIKDTLDLARNQVKDLKSQIVDLSNQVAELEDDLDHLDY